MSWGRIEWSMSTIVASGSTVRIAPFIAPMYSPAPKSVVSVTIALIRSTPSAQASQALFDSSEFLLSTGELGIRLRRAGLAVLQFRFPRLQCGLGRLQCNPFGPDSIALPREFRKAFLEALALRGDGLLPSLPVRLGTRHALLGRGFAVFDLVDPMRQALFALAERGLLFLELAFARFDRALLEFGLLGGVFLFEPGPSGSQVPFDDLGRVGPFLGSLFDGRCRLLAFLDRGLPAFGRRLPFVEVTFGRLDRPEPLLGGPLRSKQLDGLRFHLRAIRGELLVHPVEPTLQLIERLPAGCEISLSSAHVDLSLTCFAFLLRDLPILSRQVLRELLHAFGRPLEFLTSVVEAYILSFEGFGLFADLRGLLGELRLARLELCHPSRERFFAFLHGLFSLRDGGHMVAELRLAVPDGRLLGGEEPFASFRLLEPVLEHLPGLGDLLGLDLLGGPTFLEPAEDQAARLLHRLEFGPERVEFALSRSAPLVLLLEFPFPAVELFFAVDECPFLVPAGIEFLLVRLALAGLLGDRLLEHRVRVSDALHRGLRVTPLEVVDADRGMAVVVRADLELGPGARRVLQDLGKGVVAGHVDLRSVLGKDPIAPSQDEDPLRWGVASKDRGLQDPVELHRPKLGEDGPDHFGPSVGDPFDSTGRDFHRVLKIIVTLRRFPRKSDP